MLTILLLNTAAASYGQIESGYPNWGERSLHRWTNAVRVDPLGFEDEYPCDAATFSESERSPQGLLYYDLDINDAARFHSIDMVDNSFFSHTSSDGTAFGERVARFYTESGFVGENIASGYPDTFAAVMHGWMCSSGHRENIMRPEFNELGTGVIGTMYTQDFAAGVVETSSPVAMGLHDPESPDTTVSFMVDWQGHPDKVVEVVLDGSPIPTHLVYGNERLGMLQTDLQTVEIACHSYWFRWSTEGRSGSYPETGSFLFGRECGDESWTPERSSPESDTGDSGWDSDLSFKGCACSAQPRPLSMLWLVVGLILPALRRR